MSLPYDAKSRDEIFMDWIAEQFRDLKGKGVSRTDAASKGKVSRNQTYEWEGRGQKGFSRPRPDTIKAFCIANGIDWRIPFRILGYDTSGRTHEELAPRESDLDRQIRLIKTRLDQKPPTEERRRLERLLVRARRQLEERRQMDEEIAELLGGADEPSDDRP